MSGARDIIYAGSSGSIAVYRSSRTSDAELSCTQHEIYGVGSWLPMSPRDMDISHTALSRELFDGGSGRRRANIELLHGES